MSLFVKIMLSTSVIILGINVIHTDPLLTILGLGFLVTGWAILYIDFKGKPETRCQKCSKWESCRQEVVESVYEENIVAGFLVQVISKIIPPDKPYWCGGFRYVPKSVKVHNV